MNSCSGPKIMDGVDWNVAGNYYLSSLDTAIEGLESLKNTAKSNDSLKYNFKLIRQYFKKAEPYASYLNPPVGHQVNGPALPVFLEDNSRIMPPIGLQKIEESIFEGDWSENDFYREIDVTIGLMKNLRKNLQKRELNANRFFIATHQQLFRIVSFGISGFDTPVSHFGIEESAVSLESLYEVYSLSLQPLIRKQNKPLDEQFHKRIISAVTFLRSSVPFEEFDRFIFLRDYMNPITRTWVSIRKESKMCDQIDGTPFNFDAPTFFERNSFNTAFFTPAVNRNAGPEMIALGKRLFNEPKLSSKENLACISCHKPEMAYADGLQQSQDNKGGLLMRNTPTLINSVFQQKFFWDGRSQDLIEQISAVFTNEDEFNTQVHQLSDAILEDPDYKEELQSIFGSNPKNSDMVKAIASYITELNGFNSKFDRNIRGEEDNFTDAERLGFNVFMGKGLCATCHFIPLTNGTVPPFFQESEKEVIGVPESAENLKIDDDNGFYHMYRSELHKGMFKTPTVRNSSLTAPYMHNGVYQTLEEVIEFYDLGGGGGLGFDLEYLTLPFDKLELSEEEKSALVAFLKTLEDTAVDKGNYSLTVNNSELLKNSESK
ncbi:cytochrome-c peroxidase [Robertkochia solimangrovi]|uniref:cytochrome-c peroxidase n=1 Tax=Robertkochia solimangrovi TaxID=2213046 RepID=UPI001F5518C1|nr:cytochrome c peroxidase [Robertkochia solimangrovi]